MRAVRPSLPWVSRLWDACLGAAVLVAIWRWRFVHTEVGWGEVWRGGAGFLHLVRVPVLICLAALVWVPVGIWIGMRPAGPSAAAGGAVPGRLPGQPDVPGGGHVGVAVALNPDIWLSPLMILGTQWYSALQRDRWGLDGAQRAEAGRLATWA